MAPTVPADLLEPVSVAALLGVLVLSTYLLRRNGNRRLLDPLRKRFLLGVPWGTLVVICGIVAVYYLLQGGGQRGGPVVVAYRSWSLSYPVGMLTASFAHASDSHITGNLVGTLAFAPIVEYVWSHYPTERGSQSFADWKTNPFVRILLFVTFVFLAGLVTSLFTPGALIGFSGVVFAFAGVAVVTRPVAAVFALVGIRVIRLTYNALVDPVVVARGSQRFVTPHWADVAIQGHTLGLLVGVLGGFALVRARQDWPNFRHVWFATLAFGVAESMYAFYWYLSGTEYVLFRGLGTAAVFLLAGVVAVALASSDRVLVSHIDLSRRETAVGVLACVVLAISLVAIPYNVASIDGGSAVEHGVEVRDYTITYAEDVPNQYIAAVQIPYLRDSLTVTTSGVIVTSERRNAWEVVVPAGRLASNGQTRVPVGGPGWRETVVVNRSGWRTVGGNETYTVTVERPGDDPEVVFASGPANVSAVLNGSRIEIRPGDSSYQVVVSRNRTVVDIGRIPAANETTTVGSLTFVRTDGTLRASTGQTRLKIATRQP